MGSWNFLSWCILQGWKAFDEIIFVKNQHYDCGHQFSVKINVFYGDNLWIIILRHIKVGTIKDHWQMCKFWVIILFVRACKYDNSVMFRSHVDINDEPLCRILSFCAVSRFSKWFNLLGNVRTVSTLVVDAYYDLVFLSDFWRCTEEFSHQKYVNAGCKGLYNLQEIVCIIHVTMLIRTTFVVHNHLTSAQFLGSVEDVSRCL
jgi:hypothetical protein